MAKPGALTTGKLPGRSDDAVAQFVSIYPPGEKFTDQTVSQRLMGGWGFQQAVLNRGGGFVDPAGAEHLTGSAGDALTKEFGRGLQFPGADVVTQSSGGIPLKLQNRFPGQKAHFEGADQSSAAIFPAFERRRIEFGHFAAERFFAFGCIKFGIEFGPERPIGGEVVDSVQESLHIHAGPAGENGEFAPGENVADCGVGQFLKLKHIDPVMEIECADQMMSHAALFSGRGLCRADFKPPVELHGIDGDDFAAELFRRSECECAFAGGGRPHEDHEGEG